MSVATQPRFAAWLRRELDRTGAEHPALVAFLGRVWRRPEPVTITIAAVTGAIVAMTTMVEGDAQLFREAGVSMLGPGFLDVFANGKIQVGPLYLLPLGLVAWVLDLAGVPAFTVGVLGSLQAGLLVWYALWLTRRYAARSGVPALPALWAVGLLLAVGGFVADPIGTGHPEELLVGLMLGHAALCASLGRGWAAGLLLGLAGGVKQWAPIGGGLLLLARRWRRVLGGAAVAAAVVVLLYGPFLAFGTVNTFGFSWLSDMSHTFLGYLGAPWGLTQWQMRVVQGGIAGAVGALVAWRRPDDPLASVIAAVAVRLLLDPLVYNSYYLAPLVALLAVWAWTGTHPLVVRWRVLATVLAPLVLVAAYVPVLQGSLPLRLGAVLLVLGAVLAPGWPRRGAAGAARRAS